MLTINSNDEELTLKIIAGKLNLRRRTKKAGDDLSSLSSVKDPLFLPAAKFPNRLNSKRYNLLWDADNNQLFRHPINKKANYKECVIEGESFIWKPVVEDKLRAVQDAFAKYEVNDKQVKSSNYSKPELPRNVLLLPEEGNKVPLQVELPKQPQPALIVAEKAKAIVDVKFQTLITTSVVKQLNEAQPIQTKAILLQEKAKLQAQAEEGRKLLEERVELLQDEEKAAIPATTDNIITNYLQNAKKPVDEINVEPVIVEAIASVDSNSKAESNDKDLVDADGVFAEILQQEEIFNFLKRLDRHALGRQTDHQADQDFALALALEGKDDKEAAKIIDEQEKIFQSIKPTV